MVEVLRSPFGTAAKFGHDPQRSQLKWGAGSARPAAAADLLPRGCYPFNIAATFSAILVSMSAVAISEWPTEVDPGCATAGAAS